MVRIGPLEIGILGLATLGLLAPVAIGFTRAGGVEAAQRGGARIAALVEDPVRGGLDLFLDSIRSIFGGVSLPSLPSIPPIFGAPTPPVEQPRCPNPADPRCDPFLPPPPPPPVRTFRECYQRRLSDREFNDLVNAGAPCVESCFDQFGCSICPGVEDLPGGFQCGGIFVPLPPIFDDTVSDSERSGERRSFRDEQGGFGIHNIFHELGLPELTDAGHARLRLKQTDLGFQVQAFERGEITEDTLRQGFRQSVGTGVFR